MGALLPALLRGPCGGRMESWVLAYKVPAPALGASSRIHSSEYELLLPDPDLHT